MSNFNPLPNDLKFWCISHGPADHYLTDDESNIYNPLLLDYTLVYVNVNLTSYTVSDMGYIITIGIM